MNRLFTVVVILISFSSQAQLTKDAYEKQVYNHNGQSLNYRILYPEGFNKNKSYPVVLFLHGAGERGSDNEKQLIHGSSLFLDEGFRKDHPSIVIFPQCPQESYWANVDVDRTSFPLKFNFKEGDDPTYPLDLVISLMDSIKASSISKDDQIYVGGLSMGGMGTFEIVSRRPDLFAAAIAICGGAHPARAKTIAGNVPMWIFHGAQDNVVLPSYSTDMVIAIRKLGGTANYTLYKDANHGSWNNAFAEPELISWLYSNKKK
tara:strand:- start:5 stop:787 length:783 start_codon:yes stop_codon:yes gene_type:complete